MDAEKFKCKKCGKMFDHESVYLRHINRKTDCGIQYTDKYKCDHCGKKFAKKRGLKYHTDHNVCIKNKSKSELFSEIERLKIVNSKLNNEIINKTVSGTNTEFNSSDNNNNNSNNSNNNNHNKIINNPVINNPVIVVPFGSEDYSKISNSDYKKIFDTCFMSVPNLISKIHCNKDIPEHHNIKKTNLRDNMIHIYDGTEWIAQPVCDILEKLYGKATDVLYGKFIELKDHLDDKMIEKFNKYIEKMDTRKCFDKVEDELILVLYNSRNIVNKTHKQK